MFVKLPKYCSKTEEKILFVNKLQDDKLKEKKKKKKK